MCELLAFSSQKPHHVNHILKAFYKRSPYHPHGWGLGLFGQDQSVIQKEPVRAIDSQFLSRQLKRDLTFQNVLGHIRFATVGHITKENTHPFIRTDKTGRTWVQIHNGTIFEDDLLTDYETTQQGDTDSERMLMYLIDKIDRKSQGREPLNSRERFEIVSEHVREMAPENKLNLILYDGEQFYIHVNTRGTMFKTSYKDGVLISTTRLKLEDHPEEEWSPVPMCQLHCFKDGELLYLDEEHGHEYIPDPEVEKFLYLQYAAL